MKKLQERIFIPFVDKQGMFIFQLGQCPRIFNTRPRWHFGLQPKFTPNFIAWYCNNITSFPKSSCISISFFVLKVSPPSTSLPQLLLIQMNMLQFYSSTFIQYLKIFFWFPHPAFLNDLCLFFDRYGMCFCHCLKFLRCLWDLIQCFTTPSWVQILHPWNL